MEIRVASLTDVPIGEPKYIEVEGKAMVLVRAGEGVYACSDVCTHQGGPLSEGQL